MVRRVDREISQYRTRRPHKQKRTILIATEGKNKTENAIKNAKIKEQYHLNQSRNINLSEANPSTQVYKIITSLQKLSK